MANTILTIDMITKEALRVLHEQLVFTNKINKQYDASFANKGAQIGDTLRIRKPAQFKVREGKTYSAQDFIEQNTTLTVDTQLGIDVTFTDEEMTLELNDFSEQFLRPAMAQLATSIEEKTLQLILQASNSVYNASGLTFKDLNKCRASLKKSLAPTDSPWVMILDPETSVNIVDELKGLFQDSTQIAKQYREGMLGKTAMFNFYESNILPTYTNPSDIAATVTVAEGASTATFAGLPDELIPAGFRFTVSGLKKCHPETKKAYKDDYEFVTLADFTPSGGAGSVAIYPVFASGTDARQNAVGTLPTAAAISVNGAADEVKRSAIGFHKDAFTMATADLPVPRGTDMASRQVMDGMSMRFVRDFDITSGDLKSRFDILFGFNNLREQFAVLGQEPDV